MKLNSLIAKVEAGKNVLSAAVSDYIQFFSNKKSFIGYKKTYTPLANFIDEPSFRGIEKVVTTVEEKLKYFEDSYSEHIDNLFIQEATNASNTVKTHLVVDGFEFGELSSLELLRLKDLLQTDLVYLYKDILVRSDSEIWNKTTDPEYSDRAIWEQPILTGVNRTTTKSSKILEDPNIEKLADKGKYTPQVVEISTQEATGNYTSQKFSGEISHAERAAIQKRKSRLLVEVIAALKEANDTQVIASYMTGKKLFDYLHRGTNS